MKRKIIGILVCTLLITIAIPMVSGIEQKPQIMSPGMIDQQQPNNGQIHWLPGGVPNWQQFYNRGEILEEVELHFGCWYSGSYDVTLSIEDTVGGTLLTSVTYQAAAFPLNVQTWFTFDVPDVKLTQGQIYYMVIRFDPGSEYGWSGDNGNPYPLGISSRTAPDWDYAFRTIVNKPLPKSVNTPFLNFLESHPNLFPLLQRLFQRLGLQ